MPKNPKTKKLEKSLEGKSSSKKKTAKKKFSDSSKSKAEIEEIQNLVIEDVNWQCSIVLLVPQTHSLYDFLLQILVDLPENFTVITKDSIANTKGTSKSRKGSKSRTSVRSTSKSSKQSGKAKQSKKKSKQEIDKKEYLVESSNDEVDHFKECLALKKLLIDLRSTDIANMNKMVRENQTDSTQSKVKNKDMSSRGLGDNVDSKITVIEGNSTNNENILHRFVILLGFYNSLLPEVLKKQNVSLKAIINVSYATDDNIDTYYGEKFSTVTAKSRRKPSVKSKKGSLDEKVSYEYSVFLEKICEFSRNVEFLEKCKDVVFLNYSLKNLSTKTKETELKYKSAMLGIFYKIREAWHKYKVYTETIYVQNIPLAHERLKLDDAKIYNTMISMVPLECTSTAVILHCIIEQIAWWNDKNPFGEETNNPLQNDNNTLSNTSTTSKSFSKNVTPILIHHRDEIKYNTFHLDLPEFNFEDISTNIFMKSPVFKLWERYPPHPKPVQKWYEFQLQKLQKLNDNFIFKLDSLFPIYLHHLLMDTLTFKTIQFSNSNDDTDSSKPEIKKVHQIFSSTKESDVCDSNSNLFVKEIIYNILSKIPNFSVCQNYAEVLDVNPNFSVETTKCNSIKQPVYTNRLRNKPSKEFLGETLLQKRELHKQEKLNKLVSFLNCSEFVNLYEDCSKPNFLETNRLEKYRFIETLNTQTLCQCLQLASQKFSNINYDYFPVTDSILLWFNNSVQDKVLSSCTSKGILETPLGFRDFYSHKLRESTDFTEELIKGEVASRKSLENISDLFVDELKADPEAHADYHSIVENIEKHFTAETSNLAIKYNLGSLWMESTDTFNHFFSEDSSSVTVKRASFFYNKAHTVVNINKNNTSLRYELDPESSNSFVQLVIDVNDTLNLNCVLMWDIIPENSSLQRNNTQFSENVETGEDSKLKLNCSINITLPSGLFIEVVPTNSVFGPFYVRQRYLGKGPNCSSIWDETCRCYFNNGMVLIFRVDGSVDILYNNGTTVKCHSLEQIKPDDLSKVKDNKKDKNIKEANGNGDSNEYITHRIKEDESNQQKKAGKVKPYPKKPHFDLDGKEKYKQNHRKKDVKRKSLLTTQNQEENVPLLKETEDNVPLYKVVQHSVLSWDGVYSQYDSGNCTDVKNSLSLRAAFDMINHELYWQRSDGMTGLQAPDNHVIKFPDGSKTTSTTIDNKELTVENDYGIIYYTSGDLVKVESFIESHNTNSTGIKLNKGNGVLNQKKDLLGAPDILSIDSFGTESIGVKGFVYIENGFLMEHTNYASVEYSNEKHEFKLDLPGNCCIIVDESGQFSFEVNTNERIILCNKSLRFEANVLSSSTLSKSSTTLRFENVDTIPITYSQTEDSFGNIFSVDERGNTTYLPSANSENADQPYLSRMYSARFPQNTERFFVFNRDLTGYEMIHEVEQANILSNEDVRTIITPVGNDGGELCSLYMQLPIYRSKCEEFIMHNIFNVNLSLIKRKDLLKAHKIPETIWFYPAISLVKKLTEKNEMTAHSEKTLKAMMIAQRLKVKKNGLDVALLFSKLLSKYMEVNEQVYQRYLNYLPKETLREEDLIECEKNRMNFLGSKSYYLTDNLPVVITGEIANEKESNKEIFSIFSASESKVLF